MRKSFPSSVPRVTLLLAMLTAWASPANALVYEIHGEDGRLGTDSSGDEAVVAPYFGPLAPGQGYDSLDGGFVWPHHGVWQRLDVSLADGVAEAEIALEGPSDAAYLVKNVDDEGDPGILVSDWDWSDCCGDKAAAGEVGGPIKVDVMVSSYSGIGHWYLITGDVIRPQAMNFQTKVAMRDGSTDIPVPALPALLALGGVLLAAWQRRRGREMKKGA